MKELTKITQIIANTHFGETLKVDGIYGKETLKFSNKLSKEIERIFDLKGYRQLRNSLIGIRTTNNIYTNLFDDILILNYLGRNYLVEYSSKPGLNYVQSYKWVKRIKGVACVVPNQYPNLWTEGTGVFSGNFYLRQVSKIDTYRDTNLDTIIDKRNVTSGIYGIHLHSWRTWLGRFVNNLSAGCQVLQSDDLLLVKPIFKEYLKVSNIGYTLLEYSDFKSIPLR